MLRFNTLIIIATAHFVESPDFLAERAIHIFDMILFSFPSCAWQWDFCITNFTIKGHEQEAFCKRLMKYESGISLVSTNPVYESKHYTNEEIEKLPVKILGKVVELRAKF